MTFAHPTAWLLAALLPLLFVRGRQRQVEVPALFLFAGLPQPRAPRRPLLLPLLAGLAMIAAASEPLLLADARRVALLIDTSASMQAGNRAAEARAAAKRWLGSLPEPTAVDVWETAPFPRLLKAGVSPRAAASFLTTIAPASAPDPPDAVLVATVIRLRRDHREVRVVTDRPADESWDAVAIGKAEPNQAINHFSVAASPLRTGQRQAAISVESFTDSAKTESEIVLRDGDSGQPLYRWRGKIAPDKALTLIIPRLPAARRYRAELTPTDILPADNVASVAAPAAGTVAVRIVTPDAAAAESLCSLGPIECEVLPPGTYSPHLPPRPTVFHLSAPRARDGSPPTPSLFLLPPPGVAYLPLETGPARAVVGWTAEHPLTRDVNFDLWQPRSAVAYRPDRAWKALVRTAEGGTVLVSRTGPRMALIGAPLLPLRTRNDLPGSILLLDALAWLTRGPSQQAAGVLSPAESNLRHPEPLPSLPDGLRTRDRREPISLGPLPVALALALLLADLWRRGRASAGVTAPLVAAALLVIALFGPEWRVPAASRPFVLLDASASLSRAERRWMLDEVDRLRLPPATPCVLFAASEAWELCSRHRQWQEDFLARGQEDTNIARALLAALSSTAPGDPPLKLHLFTDGWETEGDAVDVWERLGRGAARLEIHTPPKSARSAEVSVAEVRIPSFLRLPGSVRVPVALENSANRELGGRLRVDVSGGSTQEREVRVPPGSSLAAVPVQLPSAGGSLALRARFVPGEGQPAAHSTAARWVARLPRARVALVAGDRHDVSSLARALEQSGFEVEIVRPREAGRIAKAADRQVLILANVTARSLPRGFLRKMEAAVRSGAGVVMLGGERSLGLGGFQKTAIADALPVYLEPPRRREQRTAVLVVVDKSGSMHWQDRLLYAKAAAKAVRGRLRDTDLFGVIGFDTQAFTVVPLGYVGRQGPQAIARIDRLRAAGRTYLLPALEEAARALAAGPPADRRHVVILSDGETGGASSLYLELASKMHEEQGITVSAIAVGDRPNLHLLSRLARFGGGAFHHTRNAKRLPDLFLSDLEAAMKEETMMERKLHPVAAPSPILGPLAEARWPPLRGIVETKLRPGARQDLGVRESPDLPLLASWTHGRGRVATFTSDAGSRWAAPWVDWPGYRRFWEKVVEWTAGRRGGPLARWHVAATPRGGRTSLTLTALEPLAGPVILQTGGSGPDGRGRPLLLTATAPDRFVGEAQGPGPVRFAVAIDEGGGPEPLPPLVVQPRSEVPRRGINTALLDALLSRKPAREATTRASLRPHLAVAALAAYALLGLLSGMQRREAAP